MVKIISGKILDRNIQAAQRMMESRRDQPSTLFQSQEIHDLKEQVYILERRNRELEREVSDYRNREQELLDEIEELNEKLRYSPQPRPLRGVATTPYIMMEDSRKGEGKGLAEDWDFFMYAYTDEIFVQSDKPDLLLCWNGLFYTNPNGTVRLNLPVTQKTLDEHNILKVRPLTEEELDDITNKYNLK